MSISAWPTYISVEFSYTGAPAAIDRRRPASTEKRRATPRARGCIPPKGMKWYESTPSLSRRTS